MEEAATSEKREDQLKSTEDKNKDGEEKNSEDKDDETVRTPVAQTKGNESSESGANAIDNSHTLEQVGNQTVNVPVKYDETNQGAIDQEQEHCEPINDDNNPSQDAIDVTLSKDNELQKEGAVETHTSATLEQSEQPDKEDDVENIVPLEEVENENRLLSQEMTEGESTKSLPSANVSTEKSPEEDVEKTEVAPSEVPVPATPSSAEVVDKKSSKEEMENTTTTVGESPDDLLEQQKKEEKSPVCAETSEVVETTPSVTGEGDEQQPGDKDEEKVDETEKDTPLEDSQSKTTWHDGDKETSGQKAEGYSTTVVAGVVVHKPLSSKSNEPKKPAKGSSSGSVFKKMSWGSLFGRKRSTKDEPNMAQQAVMETQVDDVTDGVQENNPDNLDKKENSTQAVDATVEDVCQDAGEAGEAAVVAEKPQVNETEVSPTEEEDQDIAQGAIIPLEECVVDEEKTTKVGDDTPEQDEHKDDVETPTDEDSLLRERIDKDDVETPTDEDSLLRERIAKRESGTPSQSPTKRMHMRMSYAEGNKEVEVIGTLEAPAQHKQDKHKTAKDNRVSCRELGVVDHEGWLTKRGGGAIFASWKRKWVVLKEGHVYYYKTSFDLEAGGVIDVKDHIITAVPEMKKKFCFKIESEDPKATKLYFAADSQEEMDRWISVLTSAGQGEIINHETQKQESSDVRMRKKTNSMGKRAGSVLGMGGYYSYNGQLEKNDQKRRASFGSSPKEAPKTISSLDNPENNDRSKSPIENATLNDIQKLLTTEAKSDSVDAAVAMETPSTAPLNEESHSSECTPTVAPVEEQSPVEVEAKMPSSETTKEECPSEVAPKKTIAMLKVSQSETKDSSVQLKAQQVAMPSEINPKPSEPTGPSNTTWYYVLDDDNNDWIDLDEQKAMASKPESDELLLLVRTIKDSRLSIIGTPLPGNKERARSMTHISKQNQEILKLRGLKRTLKDKQRDLMAMDELLTQDINRQSIHEWKTRYSHLTPEDDTIEEDESNGSGMPAGEGDGEVKDTSVREEKVGNGTDVQEVKLEEHGQQENMNTPEHKEVRSDGEFQDKPEEVKVKKDGESQNNGGETKFEEDRNGGDSPKDNKLDDSGDEPTNAKNSANDVKLAKEDTPGKTDEAAKHDLEDGESAEQTTQEETTEQNNNGETNKIYLLDQKVEETEKNDSDKEDKKSIDTTETLPMQDQDSMDTRL